MTADLPAHGAPSGASGDDPAAVKAAWRRRLRAQRAAASPHTRHAEARALAAHWRSGVLAGLPRGATVCAYVPMEPEPGSVTLLDDARTAGARVLLPVTGDPGPLHWAEYRGEDALRPARYGLREPDGPVLPPSAVAEAAVILVPALGVDRRGVRLGRGGGYYDRTLPLAADDAELMCLVRDDELVDRLPDDPHDVPVTAVLTPGRGIVRPDRRRAAREQPLP